MANLVRPNSDIRESEAEMNPVPESDSDEPTLREIADYLRQIESDNYNAALARAEREIAHESTLLDNWWQQTEREYMSHETGKVWNKW